MPNVKGKLPPLKATNLVERMVEVRMPEVAVIATENPIQRYDEQTKQVVNEVLLMDGIEWRSGRNQIPIVDSHNDRTVRNIFGSIRHMQVMDGELVGKPEFASDEESQTIGKRLAEGHITDFSITARPTETIYVKRGETYQTSRGNVIQGPALIHTRWQPLNASICATGADECSTVRRSYTDLQREVIRMDEALLAQLSAVGLPEGMTDPNQVLTWCLAKLAPAPVEVESEPVENMADKPAEEVKPPEPVMNMASEEKPMETVENQIARALSQFKQQDEARRKEIRSACTLARVERAFADELCDAGVSVEEANRRIIQRMATPPLGTSATDARVTGDGNERLFNALGEGLVKRSMSGARINKMPELSKDAKDFAAMPMKRVAELLLRSRGINTDRMNDTDICKVAMGNSAAMRAHRIERAYHTTGSFSNLLLDAANKTLLAAYEESPQSWNLWARQAPSTADFKNINRIRFGESPSPEIVPEKQEYKEKAVSDSRESYRVEKYGAIFTVSWETVVNDDLDAISRIPAMHGAACRRKVNSEVYASLIANANMGDGNALFSAAHSNQSASAGNPAVGTLNTAFAAMRRQVGLSSEAILNIVPRFLIVPVALEATALELVNSTSYIVANGNQGVQNIYGVGGVRSLTVIGEPILDASSATAWYLAADSSQIDTVEVSFLQGEESPVLEDEWDFNTDVYKYKVRQTFGVKPIDWRGLWRNISA
jgi:hypothetical protein